MSTQTHPNRLTLGVELTGHCDLRCRHCLRSDLSTVREFDIALFERLADEALELGSPQFAFTGGEVTLHPQFFDFLRILKERALTCRFITNGNSFARFREQLLEFRDTVKDITLSIDGATRETHDGIRGKGSFDKVLMAAALARRDGQSLTVQMVVGRTNRHELGAMVKLCESMGIRRVFFLHVEPVKRAEYWKLTLSPDERREVEREVAQLARDTRSVGVIMGTGHSDPTPIAHCQTLTHVSYNIDCHGRMTFCCQLSGSEGRPENADVIADLHDVSLVEAIDMHLALSDRVTRARLAYLRDPENKNDPNRDFHCLFCMKAFGKLAHVDERWTATLHASPTEPKKHRLRIV